MTIACEQLMEILDEERGALLSGNLEALEQIAATKEVLCAGFQPSTPEQAQELRRRAQENQALLEAARAGLKSVETRLADIRAAQSGSLGYRPDGSAAAVSSTARYERRT